MRYNGGTYPEYFLVDDDEERYELEMGETEDMELMSGEDPDRMEM